MIPSSLIMLSTQWTGPWYLGLGMLVPPRLDSVWHCRRTFTMSPGDMTDICQGKIRRDPVSGKHLFYACFQWRSLLIFYMPNIHMEKNYASHYPFQSQLLRALPELYLLPNQTGRLRVWCLDHSHLLAPGLDIAGSSCMCQTPLKKSWRLWWWERTFLWRSHGPGDTFLADCHIQCRFFFRTFCSRRSNVHTNSTYPFFWKRGHCTLP